MMATTGSNGDDSALMRKESGEGENKKGKEEEENKTKTKTKKTKEEEEEEDREMERNCEALGSIGALFGDPLPCHGDAHTPFLYKYQPGEGERTVKFRLSLPASDVDLMAHYVWEASIKMADLVLSKEIEVKGKRVLELGAGCGLPSLAATTCGAKSILCTDYPDEAILATLKGNVEKNLDEDAAQVLKVQGHAWGTPLGEEKKFDVIMLADCLWLEDQQRGLLKSIRDNLANDGVAYLTFMEHNDHVREFFPLAKEFSLDYEELASMPWGGRELEDFDLEDEEADGLVYFGKMNKVQGHQP